MSLRAEIERDIRATLMPGFAGYSVPEWITEAFAGGLRSVCVYGNNVRNRVQLHALGRELRAIAPAALIAIDEEGGEVTRLSYLEGSPYPGAAVLGRIDDETYTEEIGRRVANEILSSGFNLALAPNADVNSNPLNPVIGTRSFGADPDLTARHVAAWVRGLEGVGAIACPKHFPGHGDTSQDSHLALPTVTASRELLTQRELPPFSAAFAAGARTVMTSHILLPEIDPGVPATFSKKILQGLLRDELGFSGVVVSDALDMHGASGDIGVPEAAVRALSAGCDLLCVGVNTTAEDFAKIVSHIADAIASGRLDRDRVADAAGRVRELSADAAGCPALGSGGAGAGSAVRVPVDPRAAITGAEVEHIEQSFGGREEAGAWLSKHPRAAIIRLESESNLAVGIAPWGPFAAAVYPFPGREAESTAFANRVSYEVNDATWLTPEHEERIAATGVIVIGREIHRRDFALAAIDRLRAAGVPLLVVEMCWPVATGDYPCLVTYGSSALVGTALAHFIEVQTQ